MEDATVVFSWAASAIGIVGFLAVVIQQILFYRKDSKTMDRIEGSISSGHGRLEARMEREHQELDKRMEREHQNLHTFMSDKVLSAITDVDKRLIQEFTEQKTKQNYLKGNERVILESIDNLKAFAGVMEDLKKENVQLKEQNRILMMENKIQQEKIKSLEQQPGHQRDVCKERAYDIENETEL